MPNQKNLTQVKNLETKLEGIQALFFADYAGLTVKEQRQLRSQVKAAGGELVVAKNTLLKIALKNQGYEIADLNPELKGQKVTLFAPSDAVAPLKALVEFSKANEKELPQIKAGVLGKEVLTVQKIMQLAALPSKVELLAKLLGTLANPARNLVGVLTAPTRNLVYALSSIQTKKAVQ